MSYQDLKAYVGATSNDDSYVESCYDQAVVLVEQLIATADVPTEVRLRCYLEAGSELYHRRNAPNGVAQFSAFDGQVIRVARDPLVGVYPLIKRFLRGIG